MIAEKDIVLLDYKDNFCDNLSIYAYGKIISKKTNKKCFYENNPKKRDDFEKMMNYFSLDCNYISSSRVDKITSRANKNNSLFIDKPKKIKMISQSKFKIDDLKYLNNEILRDFKLKNLDFIKNHDILDDIKSTNSIGLYIDSKDYKDNLIDWKYINNALERLNKYVKKPVLYVFSSIDIKNKINFDIPIKILDDLSSLENFYFLANTKHEIILDNNSYSFIFWSGLMNPKSYSIKTVKKTKKKQNLPQNWIAI